MKNETKAYIKNVVKNRFFFIDLINVIIGVIILVLAAMSLFGINMIGFAVMFTLGTVMMALNCYKCIKTKAVFGVAYGIFMLVMAAAAVITFRI